MLLLFIKYLQKPSELLPMDNEEELEAAVRKAVEIEEAVFTKLKDFTGGVGDAYIKRSRMLLSNFGDEKNPELRV
jgi:hypothetical protein